MVDSASSAEASIISRSTCKVFPVPYTQHVPPIIAADDEMHGIEVESVNNQGLGCKDKTLHRGKAQRYHHQQDHRSYRMYQ